MTVLFSAGPCALHVMAVLSSAGPCALHIMDESIIIGLPLRRARQENAVLT